MMIKIPQLPTANWVVKIDSSTIFPTLETFLLKVDGIIFDKIFNFF